MLLRGAPMRTRIVAGLLLLFAGTQTVLGEDQSSYPCGLDEACSIGERIYRAKPPEGWDGISPLPVLIHFHGWKRVSSHPLKNHKVLEAINSNGVLLVAPEGQGRTWDFWARENRDVSFVRKVLEDVAKRYPVDQSRIYATGFSYGSAMAWRIACDAGDLIAGILPAAGTLPGQERVDCATGPVNAMHVHGFKDNVMSLPLGADGDPKVAVDLWRRTNVCKAEPDRTEVINGHQCQVWSSCESGKEVVLCLHERGHIVPPGWIETALTRALKTYRLPDNITPPRADSTPAERTSIVQK